MDQRCESWKLSSYVFAFSHSLIQAISGSKLDSSNARSRNSRPNPAYPKPFVIVDVYQASYARFSAAGFGMELNADSTLTVSARTSSTMDSKSISSWETHKAQLPQAQFSPASNNQATRRVSGLDMANEIHQSRSSVSEVLLSRQAVGERRYSY